MLTALACDLGLDSLPHISCAATWQWFRRYCVAARVLTWLQQRSPLATLSTLFRDEVLKRMQELSGDDERMDRQHEDCQVFRHEQDEELILWLNRSNTRTPLMSSYTCWDKILSTANQHVFLLFCSYSISN